MCLGIPGQLVELLDGGGRGPLPGDPLRGERLPGDRLARVEVSGVTRVVNVALLQDEALVPGDWVLIHVGFALSKIDEHEAEVALATLRLLGDLADFGGAAQDPDAGSGGGAGDTGGGAGAGARDRDGAPR